MPKLGDITIYKGQTYKLVGSTPYTRKDGTQTQLYRWVSACADCGAEFNVSTPSASRKFEPSRRCAEHKRPGVRVKAVQS